MKMFFDVFSSEHYRADLQLESYNDDKAVIDAQHYYDIQRQIGFVDPIFMKIKKKRIPVYSSYSVPYDVLAVPEEISEELPFSLPSEESVLIPKNQERMRSIFQ